MNILEALCKLRDLRQEINEGKPLSLNDHWWPDNASRSASIEIINKVTAIADRLDRIEERLVAMKHQTEHGRSVNFRKAYEYANEIYRLLRGEE